MRGAEQNLKTIIKWYLRSKEHSVGNEGIDLIPSTKIVMSTM